MVPGLCGGCCPYLAGAALPEGRGWSPTPPLPTAPGASLRLDGPTDKTGAPYGQTLAGIMAMQPRAQPARNASLTVVPG